MLYFDFLQKIFSSKLYTVRKIIGWKTVQNVSLIYSRQAVGIAIWQKNALSTGHYERTIVQKSN